jgi:hypothetical protein
LRFLQPSERGVKVEGVKVKGIGKWKVEILKRQ